MAACAYPVPRVEGLTLALPLQVVQVLSHKPMVLDLLRMHVCEQNGQLWTEW